MSREQRNSLKLKLAAALAEGKSCAEWAGARGVPERTAQRWANEPGVRAQVESLHRQTYCRQRRGGQWIDFPADGHPEEDLIHALRGGVRDAFPQGLVPPPNIRPVPASRIMG